MSNPQTRRPKSDKPTAKSVFSDALELPPESRAAFLERVCAGDVALRTNVDELLRVHDGGSPFLSSPTGNAPKTDSTHTGGGSMVEEQPDALIGVRIEQYKLLERIGEGGFGAVYMAEQREPVYRKVALKLIKPGMDSRQVIARFEAERQALALMDHPHIARILDGGVTSAEIGARPYFVMEYVRGEPITAFADAQKLDLRSRLELFTQVCQAVQHAHQKGVIHRDLKPRNVLVSLIDGRAFAKVIDFGIAKATGSPLTDKTLFTEHRQLIGTPEYMSPEQAQGSPDIDTRTDVYALGVLLYELLAGATPFDAKRLRSAAFAEMQRIIKDEEPPPPSLRLTRNTALSASIASARQVEPGKLCAMLKGELDWIVMKALEKERGRRYESASHLAADVQRRLAGEPVAAAPPSAWYRLRKFVRRRRGPVIAASAVLTALVLGIIGTSWFAVDADRERDRAETALQISEAERIEKQQALDRVGREAYATAVSVAATALRNEQYEKARQRLATCPTNERKLEWSFLDAWSRSVEWAIPGESPALSPDGTKVAVNRTGAIEIWDTQTRRKISSFAADGTPVFTPDNQSLLVISDTLTRWDIESQQVEFQARLAYGSSLLDRSQRRLLKIHDDDAPMLFDMTSGRFLCRFDAHRRGTSAACFSPSGRLAATGGEDNVVFIWDVAAATHGPPLVGHSAPIFGIGFCCNETRLCTIAYDRTIRIWDANTHCLVSVIAGNQFIGTSEFPPAS